MILRKLSLLALIVFITASAYAGPTEDLISACQKGDVAKVNSSIAKKADVNKLDAYGSPVLAYAIFYPEIVKILLEKGADPNLGDYNALVNAANHYCVETVKILLEKGADPNKPRIVDTKKNIQALIDIEKAKKSKGNKFLIKAWEGELKKTTEKDEYFALQIAIMQTNNLEIVNALIEAGAKIDIKDKYGNNLIHTWADSAKAEDKINGWKGVVATYETTYGYILPEWFKKMDESINADPEEILKALINKGIPIDELNKDGMTPLGSALRFAKNDKAKMLIKNGADSKIVCHGANPKIDYTPICMAAERGDVEIIKLMVEKGCDVNVEADPISLTGSTGLGFVNMGGLTPLNIAILFGQKDIAYYLLDNGANLNIGLSGQLTVTVTEYNGFTSSQVPTICNVAFMTPIYLVSTYDDDVDLYMKVADKMAGQFNFKFTAFTPAVSLIPKTYDPWEWAAKMGRKKINKKLLQNAFTGPKWW